MVKKKEPVKAMFSDDIPSESKPRTALSDMNIHQRIWAIMDEVNYIKKDKKIETRAGSYSVTGHDAVSKLFHPLLVKHRVLMIPSVGECTQDGNRTMVKMSFRWINVDNPEDFFVNECFGYGISAQDKGIGMAISYCVRYITLKTLHLETGDSDIEDQEINHVPQNNEEPKPTPRPKYEGRPQEAESADLEGNCIPKKKQKVIWAIGFSMGWKAEKTSNWIQQNYGKKVPELTYEEFSEAAKEMEDIRDLEGNKDLDLDIRGEGTAQNQEEIPY